MGGNQIQVLEDIRQIFHVYRSSETIRCLGTDLSLKKGSAGDAKIMPGKIEKKFGWMERLMPLSCRKGHPYEIGLFSSSAILDDVFPKIHRYYLQETAGDWEQIQNNFL